MKNLISKTIVITALLLNFSQVQAQLKTKLDSILLTNQNKKVAGASVLIQLKDSIIYTNYYGKADLSNDINIDAKTIFNIGSISKHFTVFAILLLESEGKLSLQDDIRTYIPELPDYGTKITLEHLARHTSGLKNINFLARMAGWRQTDMSTHQQMLDLLFLQKTLDFEPGTNYKYSNSGTMLLAEVVNRTAENSFSEFMKHKVFEPLGMKNTFVRDEVSLVIENEAHGYYWENDKMNKAINAFSNIGYTNVYSTVEDIARWASNFRNPIVGNNAIINKMISPTKLKNGKTVEHAMGLFITPYNGAKQIQHSGSHRAYLAYFGMFPEYDLDIIICSNLANFDLFGTMYKISNLFIEKQPDTEIVQSPKPNFITLNKNEMASFSGHYWLDSDNISREILIRNDTLVYSRENGSESYFKAIKTNSFRSLENHTELVFNNEGFDFISGDEVSTFIKYRPKTYGLKGLISFTGTYFSKELNASYNLVIENNKIVAKSPKMKPIILTPIKENVFSTDQWFLNCIKFKENEKGVIEGFRASNIEVSNVWFQKLE